MRAFLNYRSGQRANRGIAIVEFVISVPLLLLLFVITAESGRLLHQYMLLSNIAAAAVRSGIQLAGMGEVCFESEDADGNRTVHNLGYSATQPSGSGLGPHWFAQRRAYVLIYHSRDQLLVKGTGPNDEPDMETEFLRNTLSGSSVSAGCSSSVAATDNELREALRNSFAVRLRGTYTPLLVPISLPLEVESRASYLVENSNFPLAGGPPCRPRTIS